MYLWNAGQDGEDKTGQAVRLSGLECRKSGRLQSQMAARSKGTVPGRLPCFPLHKLFWGIASRFLLLVVLPLSFAHRV